MKNSALNITFLCVFVAVFIGALFLIKAQFNVGEVSTPDVVPFVQDETTLVPVALAEFVNVRGERWRLPKGKQDFEVASAADLYPQFVSGTLDPLDVEPGETQKMRVVINSTPALVEVVAEITHDKGKDIVPLRLISAGAVSRAAQFKKEFFFDERGILTTREEWALTHQENSASLVASVEAQAIRQYVYEGEWVVHDTHRTTYNTVFRAKDDVSKSNFLTLAWSDPICPIATTTPNWTLSSACSLAGITDVDGVDANNLVLNSGASITLSGGAKFAYSPGNSISLMSGATKNIGASINKLSSGGSVEKKYVYYEDFDHDGYPSSSLNRALSDAAGLSDYIRMSAAPGIDKRNPTRDCNDAESAVKPGQTAWFNVPIATSGGYDYNCSSVIEYKLTAAVVGQCYSMCQAGNGCARVGDVEYSSKTTGAVEALRYEGGGVWSYSSVSCTGPFSTGYSPQTYSAYRH